MKHIWNFLSQTQKLCIAYILWGYVLLISGDGFQAECEELAQQVVVLKDENTTLVSEMRRIRDEYERLVAENTSLKVTFYFLFSCYIDLFVSITIHINNDKN